MLVTAVTPCDHSEIRVAAKQSGHNDGAPLTYTGWTSSPTAANRPNSLAMLTGNEVFQEGDG